MRFADPHWLHLYWLLPILVAALSWAAKRRQADLDRWCEPALQNRMDPVSRSWSTSVHSWLRIAALALLILAAARPQIGSRVLNVKRTGIDVVIALDTSESMKAEDLKPNRITRARQEIQSLIDRLRGDRVGLVGFAGDAFVQCPVTLDYAAARMFLRFMDTDLVPVPGTAVARAIEVGTSAFDPKEGKFKALVLITDGEDHEGKMMEAARKAKSAGVRIFAVGIGTEKGEPIPIRDARGQIEDYKRDQAGEVILTHCDPTSLQNVCRETGGRYFDGTAGGLALDRLYVEIAAMEEREMEGGLVTQYEDRFAYFAALAFLLLALDALIGNRRSGRRTRAGRTSLAAAVSALLLVCGTAHADEGSKLYQDGKYAEARDYYEAFSAENPEDSRADYNLGTSLHRTQEAEPAKEALERALRSTDPTLRSQAFYNLGNTQVRLGDLEAAQDAYRNALRFVPDDNDAKFNLELVNRLLEEAPPDSSDQEQDSQDGEDGEEGDESEENEDSEGNEDSEDQNSEEREKQDSEDQDSQNQESEDEESEGEESSDESGDEQEDSEQSDDAGNQSDEEQQDEQSDSEQSESQMEEGQLSAEEARQILEALGQQENNLQAERMKAKVGKVKVEKDW